MLRLEHLAVLGLQAGKGKHAYLVCDMIPVLEGGARGGAADPAKRAYQGAAHVHDPAVEGWGIRVWGQVRLPGRCACP